MQAHGSPASLRVRQPWGSAELLFVWFDDRGGVEGVVPGAEGAPGVSVDGVVAGGVAGSGVGVGVCVAAGGVAGVGVVCAKLIGVAISTAAAAKMNTRFMKIPSKRNPPRPALPTRARDRGLRPCGPTIQQASWARRLSQPPRLCLCRRREKKFHVRQRRHSRA